MTEAPPTLLRVDAVTLIARHKGQDRFRYARDGRRACFVGKDNWHVWVLDLVEARVLTRISVPTFVWEVRLLDDARLLVRDRAGFLRVFALPDGGEVACVRAPREAWDIRDRAHMLALYTGGALILRAGLLEVEFDGPLFCLVDLRDGSCREVSAQPVIEVLMADPWQRQAFARCPDGPVVLDVELAPDGERLAFTLGLPDGPYDPGDDHSYSRVVTLRVDDPERTLEVWPGVLDAFDMRWVGADELGGCSSLYTSELPSTGCRFVVRRVFRDVSAQTWRPTVPFADCNDREAGGYVLDDGSMLAAFRGPRRAWMVRPGPHGDVVTDALAGESPEALHATRPVLIDAWSDGGVCLALPRPNGDTDLVVRGARVATIPAAYGHPEGLHATEGWVELSRFTVGTHRVTEGQQGVTTAAWLGHAREEQRRCAPRIRSHSGPGL